MKLLIAPILLAMTTTTQAETVSERTKALVDADRIAAKQAELRRKLEKNPHLAETLRKIASQVKGG